MRNATRPGWGSCCHDGPEWAEARGGGCGRRRPRRRDTVICVSDGSASHPGIVAPAEMRRIRRGECAAGARDLGVSLVHLDLPDGALAADAVDAALHPALDAASPAAVAVTWSGDGHPDHHECAESVRRWPGAAATPILEYPVWMWHWAGPGDPAVPWHRLRELPAPPQVVDRFFLGGEWVFAP